MTMTLVQMADELLAIIEGDRPRLNKTEMREYVRDLLAANAAHLTQPAQSVDVEKVKEVIADIEGSGLSDEFTAPNQWADKLTAALQEKGNG